MSTEHDKICQSRFSTAELREIYRKIASGEDPHGDFLTSFAQAMCRADAENIGILLIPALVLARKYHLGGK